VVNYSLEGRRGGTPPWGGATGSSCPKIERRKNLGPSRADERGGCKSKREPKSSAILGRNRMGVYYLKRQRDSENSPRRIGKNLIYAFLQRVGVGTYGFGGK